MRRLALAFAVFAVMGALSAYALLRPDAPAGLAVLAEPAEQALDRAETVLTRPAVGVMLSGLTIILAAAAWRFGPRGAPAAEPSTAPIGVAPAHAPQPSSPSSPPSPTPAPSHAPQPAVAPARLGLDEGRAGRVLFQRVFPPRPPMASLTYFGGAPAAPPDFAWPCGRNEDGRIEPFDFLAQVDCAALPEGGARGALPREGVLYFFAPAGGEALGGGAAGCVRYMKGERAQFVALDAPRSPAPRDDGEWRYRWVASAAAMERFRRRYATRVEMTPHWAVAFEDPAVKRELESDDAAFARWSADRRAALAAIHGAPLAHDPHLDPQSLRGDRLIRPFEGFPPSWSAIAMIADLARDRFRADESMRHECAQAETWLARASAHPPVDEPLAADKTAFADWLTRLATDPALNLRRDSPGAEALSREIAQWTSIASILSSEACLADAGAAPRIPARVVDALRPRHAHLREPFAERGRAREHQMFGNARFVGVAAEDMPATHHLLLQLDADEALGWDIGDGAWQYWITPDDLAAGRFAAAVLTFESF